MIMSGTRDAVLLQVQPVNIHGTCYYDISYVHDDDQQTRMARVGQGDIYDQAQAGDAVRVSYLVNVVTAVERRL